MSRINLARQLWRAAQVVQDATQVVGMISHAEFFQHDFGQSLTGPKFIRIASGDCAARDQRQQLLTLFAVQFWFRTRVRFRGECGDASVLNSHLATFDRGQMDADCVGDFLVRETPFFEEYRNLLAPRFKLCGRAGCSHLLHTLLAASWFIHSAGGST